MITETRFIAIWVYLAEFLRCVVLMHNATTTNIATAIMCGSMLLSSLVIIMQQYYRVCYKGLKI